MRNSKLVAFLLALVLCVVSVAAALADFNDVSEEWIVAMEKKACTILKNEGNNIDYKTLKEVSGSYYGNEYTFFLTSAKGKQYVVQFPVAVLVEAPVREHQLFILGLETVQDVCKVDSAAVVCLAHKEHIWVHKEADTDVLHWLREPCFCEVVPDTEGLIGQLYNDKVAALSAGIRIHVKVFTFLVQRDILEPLCCAGEGLF